MGCSATIDFCRLSTEVEASTKSADADSSQVSWYPHISCDALVQRFINNCLSVWQLGLGTFNLLVLFFWAAAVRAPRLWRSSKRVWFEKEETLANAMQKTWLQKARQDLSQQTHTNKRRSIQVTRWKSETSRPKSLHSAHFPENYSPSMPKWQQIQALNPLILTIWPITCLHLA